LSILDARSSSPVFDALSMSVGGPRTPTECSYHSRQRPEHQSRKAMASPQVRLSQPPLPIVGDVLTFTMLGSLDRVDVMADLVKEHCAEQD